MGNRLVVEMWNHCFSVVSSLISKLFDHQNEWGLKNDFRVIKLSARHSNFNDEQWGLN